MKKSCLIGLTGGIGSGKSKVSRFWSTYSGFPLVDIDQICRELLEINMPGWIALKQSLGDGFFVSNGQVDRPGLRSAIFEDDALRKKVDKLIHPLALDMLLRKTESLEGAVLVDVPLLFEAGWEEYFYRTVVIYADQQTCCQRVITRDKVASEEAAQSIVAQMEIWNKAMSADHVVDNRYGWLHTRMQVVHLTRIINEDLGR